MSQVLLGILRWQHVSPAEVIHREHWARMTATICALFDGEEDFDPAELGRLPVEALTRILDAPETFHHLFAALADRSEKQATAAFLSSAVRVEDARSRNATSVDGGGWSALGDLWLPPMDPAVVRTPLPPSWVEQDAFRAPRLPSGTPIDYASPYACRPMLVDPRRGVVLGQPRRCEAALVARILPMLREADELVQATLAGTVVRRFVRVVQPRVTELGAPFTSSSSNAHIGRMVLLNPLAEEVDPRRLANALVHEAVHSLLYTMEQENPFVTSKEMEEGLTLVSPWTGGTLGLHSYIHACFVWYALTHFWLNVLQQDLLPPDGVHPFLRKATHGFSSGAIESALRPLSRWIDREVLELCFGLSAEIAALA